MDSLTRRLMMFDLYGDLLTSKQREVYDLYHQQDLSLGEIAELWRVSRASVHDLLRRTDKVLERYEEAMSLLADHIKRQKTLKALADCLEAGSTDIPEFWQDQLKSFVDELISI